MKERMEQYMAHVEAVLASDDKDTDWDEECRAHLIQLEFYKHERLVHLLVMILFAICAFIVLSLLVVSFSLMLALLFLLILVLLVPYVMHYYFLENSVQAMYDQYDRLYTRTHENGFKRKV